MKQRERLFASVLLASASVVGCVVTTFEGAGDPPRVATAPVPSSRSGKVEEAPDPSAPTEIAARHLLVAYQGALRASPSVTRSKAEAQARAVEAQKRAAGGEDFATLVKEFSDEPGAAERGGSLGRFGHGMMVPAFEKAAFKLAPGAVSDVIETQFGFHVIQRTE